MKQTKQFLRPLLMAIVMMVGMLVPQGAWAQDLRVDCETVTISEDASYDMIYVWPGGELIINEGVTLTVTDQIIFQGDDLPYGTVINYGTIIGEGYINKKDRGVLANHGHIDLGGADGYGTFTFYNTGTLGENINLTPTEECNHDYENFTVDATCTHGAGTQYRCKTCYYMWLDETSGALPHNINSHNGINICSSCGHKTYDEPTNGDGSEDDPYQIANAGNLYWFADYTRNEDNYANAILTADIVLNDGTFATDGTFTATGADEPSKPFPWIRIGSYSGTFDGNGHTISGMYVNGSFGLFYTLDGSVVNLGIVNCYIRAVSNAHTGAICNWNYGTISNCYTTGILSGLYGSGICDMNVGGSTISNCYSTCSFVYDSYFYGGGICVTNSGTISNCYTSYDTAIQYNYETASEVYGGVSADRFASGEIAYKLNGSVDGEGNWTAGATNGTQAWYQKLGEDGDSYPVLAAAEGNTVYYGYENCLSESETYSNDLRYAEKEDAPHNYQVQLDGNEKPVFVWSEDYTTATLQLVCSRDEEHTAGVEVTGEGITSEDTTPATCTAEGVRTYTAKATYEGEEYTGTKEVEIPSAGHSFVDGVCEVCHATAVAEVKIGETTTGYTDIQEALTAALNEESATLTMLADVEISSSLNVDKNGCVVTIDLNGHKISSSSNVIYLTAGKLTIEDNSIGQAGTMESDNYTTITTYGGSITIHGGTFISTDRYALDIPDNGVIGSLDGGRFISTNSNAVHSSYYTTALADGFAYYNYSSGKELESTIYNIKDENGNPAKDVIVKPTSVKATLTINSETTDCYTFMSAFNAALNSTSPATVTMLVDTDLKKVNNDYSLEINKNDCDVTLDLNGHKLTRTTGSNVIELKAGSLTITDGSAEKTGEMESNYTTVDVSGGSITIHGGTFISNNSNALYIPDNGVIASLDGGRFISTNSYAVCSSYYTTALADGFVYYNYSSGKELESTIYNIKDENGNPAKDVIVKPASVKATLTIGSETTDCYTFMSAFNAALNTTSPATVTMLVDTDLKKANNDYALSVNNSACDVTIDLNGHKLNRTTGSSVIELSAGSLTITDGSAEKTGVMESNYSTLSVSGGSITIHGGTFISQNSNGLYCYGSYTASLDGGRFISNSTNNSAVETSGSTTALAEGYSYYNFSPLKKLESTTGAIKDEDGNYAKDVTVKLSETVVPTFASLEELIAADQSFDAVNVTIEDKVQLALLYNGIYMVHLKNSEITLSAPGSDLGWASGGTVTGTLTNVAWNNTYKQLSGEDADFWSGLTCTAPSAGNVPTFASIDELLAANIESGTIVTVTINGTIAEAKYTSGAASAYAVKLDNGFVLAVMFKVTSDPEWEVDGTVSGTLENVTFINENGEPGIMCMDRNIFEELTYTAPAVVIADGVPYSTAEQYSLPADRVSMARTFTADKPSTVMLPFTVDASQISGATFHEFKGVAYDTEKGEWIATMQKVSTVEAYKPYLVIPTAGSITFGTDEQTVTFPVTASSSSNLTQNDGDWTFVALNEFKRWEAGDEEIGKAYGFAGIDKTVDGNAIHRGDFVKIAAGASAKPGRCYLVKNDGEPLTRAAEELPATIKVHFISGSANGIGTLNTETGEMTLEGWYDLNGNKIEQPSKGGVYINNNKKVMVK